MTSRAMLFGSVTLLLLCPLVSNAEIVPNSTYRLVPSTVMEARPVTAYRLTEEKVVEQKPITTYRTETVTEMREQRYRVAKPVTETSERIQRYKVMRPVTETFMREETVDRTTYETETRWREERRTVQKPVVETSEREERRTVLRPVTEYSERDESYTALRPVTTSETQWRDRSGYVDVPQYVPGPTRNRLRWLPRTAYQNPTTGLATSQRAGLYWVPQQRPGFWSSQRQFVPNFVPEQVSRTTLVPETVTRKVPVTRTRYEEEVEYRKVPVQTYRTVAEEQVRYVPETVRKPVTKTYTRKVPVTRTRWEEHEVVRRVPVKTTRIEYEEKVRRIPVEVQRTVPVQQLMEREKTIRRYVPYQKEQLIPRTVMLKEPIPDDYHVVTNPGRVYATAPIPVVPYTVARPAYDGTSVSTSPWRVIPDSEELVPVETVKDTVTAEAEPAETAPSLKGEEVEPVDNPFDFKDGDEIRGSKPLHEDE